jgi:SSS family solute:Na+ symporter
MLRLHPSTIDYVILGIYFVVVLGIGFVARLAIKTPPSTITGWALYPRWCSSGS